MKENVVICGIGYTRIGEHWDKSLRELAVEASLKALEDSGFDHVDAIYVSNMMSGMLQEQEHLGALVATYLGLRGIPACKVEAACGSGGMAIHQAFLAVSSGYYKTVLVVGVEKMSDRTTSEVTLALASAEDREYVISTGATFVGLNALLYRAYMLKYGVRQESIAKFPVIEHENALNAPHAQFRRKITLEDVLSSPLIADPLHLLECAPLGDGAAALVISCEEEAKNNKCDAVRIIGSAAATDILSLYEREDLLTLYATVKASQKAYEMAGIKPKDVDLLEVHDAFSILAPISLEDLGFAKKGEGWKLIEKEEVALSGRIPTNTMGGLKARGHPIGATGIYQAVDAILQLRNDAGKNQVDNASVALLQSIGGVGGTVTVNILKR
ncbi:MAG: thiolase domain-containing protein [Thermoprotei archaeon]|nr:MAG: thiolase domain-containing protein [Thermoprotei archaeon]RLF00155.1 MAG: thiolase domain-containing protein [Thermoprotei archaeon]HDI75000.1 thiolase domain-containing protein [Thermoprotei archaeon]